MKKRKIKPYCVRPKDRYLIAKAIVNDPCVPYKELGEQFGLSGERISQIAVEQGLAKRFQQKFTPDQVIEMRRRYHVDKEEFYSICPDYAWASLGTVRSAILGDSYRSVPMPSIIRKRRRSDVPSPFRKYTDKDVQNHVNIALLFTTGIFTIEDLAAFHGLTYNTLLGSFDRLRKSGWYIPRYGKFRKGLPEFDQVNLFDLLLFAKKNRSKLMQARKCREKLRSRKR